MDRCERAVADASARGGHRTGPRRGCDAGRAAAAAPGGARRRDRRRDRRRGRGRRRAAGSRRRARSAPGCRPGLDRARSCSPRSARAPATCSSFRETFCSQMSWRLSYDIAMAELAANSLLPAGGAGGLALGVWALRQAGMPTSHIARRTVAFFVVTSAANFFALVIVGLGVFVGIIAGRGSAVALAGTGTRDRRRRAGRRFQPAAAARPRATRRGCSARAASRAGRAAPRTRA